MVVKVFKEVDVNNDGKLSYDEFKKSGRESANTCILLCSL